VTSVVLEACALCAGRLLPARGARGHWRLLQCGRCGHVQSPAASWPAADSEAEQRRYFGDDFAAGTDAWTAAFDRANARRLARRLHSVVPAGRALEVGPGRGATLEALATAGYAAEGLDVSGAVADSVSRRTGVRVHVGTLQTYARRMPPASYDVVLMRHVLEHVSDLRQAVRAAAGLVTPGGWLHVAVPHAGAPQAALPGWSGYQPYHLHYFSVPNLTRLVEGAGFRVRRCTTREPFSGWFNAVANSLAAPRVSGGTGGRGAGAARHAYQLVRLAAGVALWPVRAAQAHLGYGEEIEIWAQRPGQ
jgi:SAM-dependent methyltransferase